MLRVSGPFAAKAMPTGPTRVMPACLVGRALRELGTSEEVVCLAADIFRRVVTCTPSLDPMDASIAGLVCPKRRHPFLHLSSQGWVVLSAWRGEPDSMSILAYAACAHIAIKATEAPCEDYSVDLIVKLVCGMFPPCSKWLETTWSKSRASEPRQVLREKMGIVRWESVAGECFYDQLELWVLKRVDWTIGLVSWRATKRARADRKTPKCSVPLFKSPASVVPCNTDLLIAPV